MSFLPLAGAWKALEGKGFPPGLPVLWVGPTLVRIPVGLVITLWWLEDRETGCSVTLKECRLSPESSLGPLANPARLTQSKATTPFFPHQRKKKHEVGTQGRHFTH
jgi:hypothetical protein